MTDAGHLKIMIFQRLTLSSHFCWGCKAQCVVPAIGQPDTNLLTILLTQIIKTQTLATTLVVGESHFCVSPPLSHLHCTHIARSPLVLQLVSERSFVFSATPGPCLRASLSG